MIYCDAKTLHLTALQLSIIFDVGAKGGCFMKTIIFHIDVNNAFLSWEALYRIRELGEKLDLRTIPSAIAGDKESRHGIILAKSMPAKEYGV